MENQNKQNTIILNRLWAKSMHIFQVYGEIHNGAD